MLSGGSTAAADPSAPVEIWPRLLPASSCNSQAAAVRKQLRRLPAGCAGLQPPVYFEHDLRDLSVAAYSWPPTLGTGPAPQVLSSHREDAQQRTIFVIIVIDPELFIALLGISLLLFFTVASLRVQEGPAATILKTFGVLQVLPRSVRAGRQEMHAASASFCAAMSLRCVSLAHRAAPGSSLSQHPKPHEAAGRTSRHTFCSLWGPGHS